jgi:hypothetical protein
MTGVAASVMMPGVPSSQATSAKPNISGKTDKQKTLSFFIKISSKNLKSESGRKITSPTKLTHFADGNRFNRIQQNSSHHICQ